MLSDTTISGACVDDFLFSEEQLEENNVETEEPEYWHILVVDDEEDIHQVTKLVLAGFTFENKGLRFYHAYSAAEAKELLKKDIPFQWHLLMW